MSLNLNQAAAAILVAQINLDNGKSFTVDQLSFGPVMTNAGPDSADYEAVVMVTGVPAQGWSGSFPYKYNRINLEEIFTADNSSFSVDAVADYAALVAAINTAMGTNMQLTTLPVADSNQLYVPGDITPAQLPAPTPAAPSIAFILTADPNSYIYRGAAILNATTSAESLAAAFTVASTGLTYTAPVSGDGSSSDGSDGTS
jgi:hypothetical protein